MTWRISGAFAAVAFLLGLAGPAHAGASYFFHKTGSNPANLPIAIEMTFDGPGVSVSGNAFGGGFDGLRSFSFRLGTVDVDLADLRAIQQGCAPPNPNPGCNPFTLVYDLAPEEGSLRLNNQSYDLAFAYDGGFLAGGFNTDGPGVRECVQTGACRYQGQWSAIPEPVTAGLLALGLAGLLGARARAGRGFVPIARRRGALASR